MEEIAGIIDTLSNLIAATELPLKPEVHFKALKEALPRVEERLKKAYLKLGGEDHWKQEF